MSDVYVGQLVHFVDSGAYTGRHLAGVVVWVWADTLGKVVNLNVQNPGTSYPTTEPVMAQHSIPQDEVSQALGTWHFIEKPVEVPAVAPISSVTQNLNIGASAKHGK